MQCTEVMQIKKLGSLFSFLLVPVQVVTNVLTCLTGDADSLSQGFVWKLQI